VKTTIFLEVALFRKAEGLARHMKVSRSRLFATALAEFIERRRNQELLEAVNKAYAGAPDAAEKRLRQAIAKQQRRRLQGQW
jgi:predicted transcriptional regulator